MKSLFVILLLCLIAIPSSAKRIDETVSFESWDAKGGFFLDDQHRAICLAVIDPPAAAEVMQHYLHKEIGVDFLPDKSRFDRNGCQRVHLYDGDDWVQESLVSAGLARVVRTEESRAAALIEIENQAILKKVGIWQASDLYINDPAKLPPAVGHFIVIDGVIESVFQNDSLQTLVLAGGLQIKMPLRLADRFWDEKGFDQMVGQKIRVRGLLQQDQNLYIRLNNVLDIQTTGQTHDARKPKPSQKTTGHRS